MLQIIGLQEVSCEGRHIRLAMVYKYCHPPSWWAVNLELVLKSCVLHARTVMWHTNRSQGLQQVCGYVKCHFPVVTSFGEAILDSQHVGDARAFRAGTVLGWKMTFILLPYSTWKPRCRCQRNPERDKRMERLKSPHFQKARIKLIRSRDAISVQTWGASVDCAWLSW